MSIEKLNFYDLGPYVSSYNNGTCGAKMDLDFSPFYNYEIDLKDYEIKKKCIIFEESEIKNINDVFSSKSSLNNTINPKDKLYFISASEFPRTHLGLFSDLKRVIKSDKCDKIVIPDSINSYKLIAYKIFIKMTDDEYFYFPDYCFGTWCRNTGVIESDVYLKSFINALLPKLTTFEKIEVKVANVSKSEIDLILNNPSKLITSKQLTSYIAPNMQTMTFEEYESFNEMLQSNDKTVLNLGIKMLNMYNVDRNSPGSSGIYIGLMIYNNRLNIKRYASKTTLFNYIEDSLGISVSSFGSWQDDSVYYKIARMSTEPEQVEYINNIIKKIEGN